MGYDVENAIESYYEELKNGFLGKKQELRLFIYPSTIGTLYNESPWHLHELWRQSDRRNLFKAGSSRGGALFGLMGMTAGALLTREK